MMLRLVLVASSLAVSAAVDYACFTGSSLYERKPKVCNEDMPESDTSIIDGGGTNTWFCSVTSVTEMGQNNKRDPPYIWSCASPAQCNATCVESGTSSSSVPKCTDYYGHDDTNKRGTVISTAGGVEVKTWCQPALNNAKKPNKLAWEAGLPLPAALILDLPYFDSDDPTSAAVRVGSPVWVTTAAALLVGAMLCYQ